MKVLEFVFDFIVNAFDLMRSVHPFGSDFFSLFDIFCLPGLFQSF